MNQGIQEFTIQGYLLPNVQVSITYYLDLSYLHVNGKNIYEK